MKKQARNLTLTAAALAVAAGGAVGVGASMSNAADTATGTVNTAGSSLSVRSGPGTAFHKVGSLKKGTKVKITCQQKGTTVTGRYGTSSWWNKIGKDRWVSDAYIYTGSDGRVADLCKSGPQTPPPPTTGSASKKVKAVIAAAKSQMGKGYLYSWGGGGKNGPSYGVTSPSGYNDAKRFGYDCSGLTQYAFWQGARKDIGGYSGSQVGSGSKHSLANRKPGDLIFWGSSLSGTTHVAIYLGGDKIIEAAPPRNKNSIRISSLYSPGKPLGTVVRPIS